MASEQLNIIWHGDLTSSNNSQQQHHRHWHKQRRRHRRHQQRQRQLHRKSKTSNDGRRTMDDEHCLGIFDCVGVSTSALNCRIRGLNYTQFACTILVRLTTDLFGLHILFHLLLLMLRVKSRLACITDFHYFLFFFFFPNTYFRTCFATVGVNWLWSAKRHAFGRH